MSGDGTYAPQSPDLSSFYSAAAGPTYHTQTGTQPRQRPLSQQSQSQFSPQQHLHSPYFSDPPGSNYQAHLQLQQPQQPLQHQPQEQHQHQQQQNQLHQHQLQFTTSGPQSLTQAPTSAPLGVVYSPRSQPQQYYSRHEQPRIPEQQAQPLPPVSGPVYTIQAPPPQQQQFLQSYADAPYRQPQQQQQQHLSLQGQNFTHPPQFYNQPNHPAPGTSQAQVKSEPQESLAAMPPRRAAAKAAQPPVIEPSPVKTKFPTARIKRIMQADEEVGKVAQQTPIAVGKALELFMVALVTKSADVAREKNSKRVSAQMLKQVVETDEQWDFLREIVSRVENEEKAAKSGRSAKAESESEEEVVEKKKVRAGRKKKA